MDIRNLSYRSYRDLYSQFRWRIPKKFNIGEAISDAHINEKGNEVSIFYEDESGQEDKWTFNDLASRSNRLANLLDDLGVIRGDRIGVCLPPRPETIAALAAIYKKGCVALSISPLFGDDAVLYRLRHCEAKVLFVEAKRKDVREGAKKTEGLEHIFTLDADNPGGKELSFDELRKSSERFERVDTSSDEPAQLFYTSGTTGPPKGALHAHRFLLGHIPCFQLYFERGPKEGDIYWTPADWGWIGALGDLVLSALHFGMPIVAQRREGKFDPRKSLEIMEKYRVTCAFIPPTALRLLRKTVEHPRKDYDLKLRAISSAGESVGAEQVKWGYDELGIPVNEFYGCTESNLVMVNNSTLIGRRPGAIGKPCPGHTVAIIGEDGKVLEPGQIGQIAVSSPDPVMFLGYWRNPEATRMKFMHSWFLTGDTGYEDTDGYFWFKGRTDDVIKSAGYRIGPEEVEHVINQHAAVLESAVIAKPDQMRGSIIKAFVVLKEGINPTDDVASEIQKLVKDKLAAYAYPREVEFRAEIPKTVTNKLKRYELRT